MTCIIAIKEKDSNKVVLVSDKRVSSYRDFDTTTTKKIGVLSNNENIVGWAVTGEVAPINVLTNAVSIPERTSTHTSDEKYIFSVIKEIRETFGQNNANIVSESQSNSDSNLILTYKGRIYIVQSDFSFYEVGGLFHAEGSGGHFSSGYITAYLDTHEDYEAIDVATRAIEACAQRVHTVGPEVHVQLT